MSLWIEYKTGKIRNRSTRELWEDKLGFVNILGGTLGGTSNNYRPCPMCPLIHMDPPPCSHSIGKREREDERLKERNAGTLFEVCGV